MILAHTTPAGYRVELDTATALCTLSVMGEVEPSGRQLLVERRDGEKVLQRFILRSASAVAAAASGSPLPDALPDRALDVFADSVYDRKDLLGEPVATHQPTDDAERALFAAAWDAGVRVRALGITPIGVRRIVATLNAELYDCIDFLATTPDSGFVLFALCTDDSRAAARTAAALRLSLAEYVMMAGGYIPRNATVARNLVLISPRCVRITPLPDMSVAARDAVIDHCFQPPF